MSFGSSLAVAYTACQGLRVAWSLIGAGSLMAHTSGSHALHIISTCTHVHLELFVYAQAQANPLPCCMEHVLKALPLQKGHEGRLLKFCRVCR